MGEADSKWDGVAEANANFPTPVDGVRIASVRAARIARGNGLSLTAAEFRPLLLAGALQE
jgi:hypothetical protein